jgi:hypothetical protein
VGLITPHRTYLTVMKTRKGRPRPDLGCSATDDDDDYLWRTGLPWDTAVDQHGLVTQHSYVMRSSNAT